MQNDILQKVEFRPTQIAQIGHRTADGIDAVTDTAVVSVNNTAFLDELGRSIGSEIGWRILVFINRRSKSRVAIELERENTAVPWLYGAITREADQSRRATPTGQYSYILRRRQLNKSRGQR